MKTIISIKNAVFFLLPLILLACGQKTQQHDAPKTHIVEIKDMKFQPAELKVNQGDTVVWINKDIVAHDVTEKDKAWASPALNMDETWKKVITKNESYYCSIHVIMKGEITVE